MAGEPRTIVRAAKELQTAANKLALLTRAHNQDTVLAALYAGNSKGRRAAARVEARIPAMAALEADVTRLRAELGAMLDRVVPARPSTPPDTTNQSTERKRK